MDKNSYKNWAIHKKKNPENVTDNDDGGPVPCTGVYCTGYVGIHKILTPIN